MSVTAQDVAKAILVVASIAFIFWLAVVLGIAAGVAIAMAQGR